MIFLGAIIFCLSSVMGLVWLTSHFPVAGLIAVAIIFAALLAACQGANEW